MNPSMGPGGNVPLWELGSWRELGSLEGTRFADVCVVGLGGSGLAAVLELRRLGVSVVGLDAGSVAAGAAGRNGGLLLAGTAAFYHDARRALGAERAYRLYQLTRQGVTAELTAAGPTARRVGSLRVAADEGERADCEAQYAAMREDGLLVERYEGPEGVGLLFEEDAAFNPLERCRRLARAALAAGAELFERSRVTEVTGTRVGTERGEVVCGAALVAVDGQLARLLPELAGRVRNVRLQMLGTAPTDEIRLPRPVYRRYGFEYYQQDPLGRIALGGFRDRGGAGEWTDDSEPSGRVQELLEEYLHDGLGVRAPITHRWAATVSYVDGVLPVAEQVRAGVWAIGAYNGTGNVIGAVLGRAAARRVVGLRSAEWEAFGGL